MDREPGRRPLLDIATRHTKLEKTHFWPKNVAQVRTKPKHRQRSRPTKKHRPGSHQVKISSNHRQLGLTQPKARSRPDKARSGKASRDGGCRYPTPKLDGPAGQPGTCGRSRDPNQTPPDSNGIPRDVSNVSIIRGHRARFQPTKKSVLTRKIRSQPIKMSVTTNRRSRHEKQEDFS